MRAYSLSHIFQGTEESGVLVGAEASGDGAVLNVNGLARLGIQVSYAALESASASPSSSASISPSASASISPSASVSPSASTSRSPSASASPSGSVSGSPSASVSPSASASAPPSGASGTVYFEASLNGSEWYALPCTPIGGGTAVVNTTAGGLWRADVSGLSLVRCRLGGVVTGAVAVVGRATSASGA